MEVTLELVEQLRQHADVSYEEARAALEHSGGDLLEALCKTLRFDDGETAEEERIRVAVIGRPNVGKSSLVNYMLGTTRVIVEDMPGTTRDAIDTPFTRDGQDYILIDTAGLRRKRAIGENSIERYGVVRGNFPAARFIGAVDALVDTERGGNLLLRQIVILSQITQSWIVHFPHRRYSE